MTDSNGLIKLIDNSGVIARCGCHYNDVKYYTQQLADYLLANGAIVPPCKVGDTVYFIDICITAEDFGKEYVTFEVVKRVSVDNGFIIFKSGRIKLWEDVFLTKEEAENELAKRGEQNAN